MGPAAGFCLAEENPALDAAVAKQGRGSDVTVLHGSQHWRLESGRGGSRQGTRPTETGNIQGFQTFCHIVVYLGGEDHPRRPGAHTLKTTQWVLMNYHHIGHTGAMSSPRPEPLAFISPSTPQEGSQLPAALGQVIDPQNLCSTCNRGKSSIGANGWSAVENIPEQLRPDVWVQRAMLQSSIVVVDPVLLHTPLLAKGCLWLRIFSPTHSCIHPHPPT